MSDSSDSGRRAVRTPPPATGGRTGSSGGARAGSGGSSGSGGRSGRIAPPLFADGEIVGERYRIIRFIGRGGMGEVYQTEDLDLDVEVALKTVRPEIAEHEKALERFRREIQLARKVTHPNVCRIFDVGRHLVTTDKEEPFEILFLTMELLRGETLAEHLRSEGPIPSGSALPILTQLASGLAAAHAAGIVHRDFKSSNVVLVRPEGGEVRAVITDFGLARGIHPEDTLTSSLSVSSQPVGTPTYMAPEQVAGREVTTATDIYAFGVVMYEMLTGVPPFVGDSPLSTAVKRLIEPPPPPSSIVPGIGRRWETVILRCLERDPIQRFDSALALGRALQGEPVETRFRRLHPSVPYPLVLVGLLLLLVTGILWFRNSSLPPTSPESVEPRRAAAVLGFRNLSGESESDWLSNALVEMLSMELSAAGNLRVVPGENVARARVELSLAGMDHLSAGNLARVARNLGVDLVLAGSYLVVGEGTERQIRLDLRLQETATGETLATLTRTGAEEDLLSMVSSAGAGLRAELGTAELTPTEAGSVRAAQPSTVEAARYYAEGVASLRLSDGLTARDLLTRAAVADPRNALVHSELAAAWAALGYDEHARRAARQALDLSAALPRQERLMVEGRYREAAREWDRAIEIYRSLSTLEPDNLEFGLRLVRAEVAAGRAESAIRTLEGLRRLPAPAGADPRIDLAEAAAAEARGDFRAEVDAATRAAEKGKRLEAWLLVAEARLAEWWARRNLGELDLATAASNEARQIAARVGDRGLLARSLNAIATVQRQRGRHREAEALDRESLQVFREIGDQRRESWALNNLARGALELGDLQQALGDFQSSLTIVREIGDRSGVARGLSNSGNVLVELGRISEADRNYRESLAIGTETGDRRAIAWAQYNSSSTVLVARGTEQAERLATDALAEFIRIGEQRGIGWCRIRLSEILLAEGRVRAAEQQAAEALERFMVVGDPRGQHAARFQQGRIAFHAGDLARAKTAHEEALQLRERLDDRWNAAISRMRLAAIALEQDRLPDASALLRAALVVFGEQHAAGREAEAQALLARVHFTGDDIAAAKEASRSATRLIADLEDQRLVAEVGIAVAAIEGASAGSEPAIKRLDDLAAAMRRAGHRDLELQARLHTGILALRSENFAAARSRLVEVRDEAASAGFGLLRDQAAELLAGGPRT